MGRQDTNLTVQIPAISHALDHGFFPPTPRRCLSSQSCLELYSPILKFGSFGQKGLSTRSTQVALLAFQVSLKSKNWIPIMEK